MPEDSRESSEMFGVGGPPEMHRKHALTKEEDRKRVSKLEEGRGKHRRSEMIRPQALGQNRTASEH